MNLLSRTGVPVKNPGDGLSAREINAINNTVNDTVDVANVYLKDYCNANFELGNLERQISLYEAITAVPSDRRTYGMTVRFLNHNGLWVTYSFLGSNISDDWDNEDYWVTGQIIDGGEW